MCFAIILPKFLRRKRERLGDFHRFNNENVKFCGRCLVFYVLTGKENNCRRLFYSPLCQHTHVQKGEKEKEVDAANAGALQLDSHNQRFPIEEARTVCFKNIFIDAYKLAKCKA